MIDDSQENDYDKAFNMAIKSLKKQIPKKPYKDSYGCLRSKCCGCAIKFLATARGGFWGVHRDAYCSNCGQAIDWSEVE